MRDAKRAACSAIPGGYYLSGRKTSGQRAKTEKVCFPTSLSFVAGVPSGKKPPAPAHDEGLD